MTQREAVNARVALVHEVYRFVMNNLQSFNNGVCDSSEMITALWPYIKFIMALEPWEWTEVELDDEISATQAPV